MAVRFALQISVGGRLTNRSHRIFHRGTDGPRTVIPVNIRGLVAADEDTCTWVVLVTDYVINDHCRRLLEARLGAGHTCATTEPCTKYKNQHNSKQVFFLLVHFYLRL